MSLYPSRHELVRLAQLLAPELGYRGNVGALSAGLCHGLCCVMIESLAIGEMSSLVEQLIKLKDLIDKQHILEPDHLIPAEDKSEIRELVKKILIHHCPEKFIHFQKAEYRTYSQELMQTIHSVQSPALKGKGGLYQVTVFCGVYNLKGNDLQNYLRSLKEALVSLPHFDKNIPFSLELYNDNDATLLGYDPIQVDEPWFFCDFEGSPLENSPAENVETSILTRAKFDDIEALAPALNIGLSRRVGATKDYVIGTELYCAKEDQAMITLLAQSFLSKLGERTLTIAGSYETADPYGKTAFHMAAGIGDIDTIRWLIQQGIPIDYQNEKGGWSALMCAAQSGYSAIVRFLIAEGADVNLLNPKNGFSSLIFAAENDHLDIVHLLIESGADLNLCNHQGYSALATAAYKGHTRIVELLLQHQADMELCNPDGFSALMCAAQNGHKDCVDLLIQYGANLSLLNRHGFSAAIIAINHYHQNIAAILIEKDINSILDVNIKKQVIQPLLNEHPSLCNLILDKLYKTRDALYNNIDNVKDYFQDYFNILLLFLDSPTKEDKKILVKLYSVLRDDIERNERQSIVSNATTFFKREYRQVARGLTASFKKECTYDEKRRAAFQLLEAIENDERCPSHRALEEGQLGKLARLCFKNVENSEQNAYSSSIALLR